jgi:hypothetical protein
VIAAAACGGQEDAGISDGTWVGTITEEGNVTTVVNESGSVWGGTATLVEEASIGVDAGPDEYMFGSISSLFADDERIYVVDGQVPVVRAYGLDGSFIADIGRQGEGPGEYGSPWLLTVHPSGRLFIYDSPNRRINVYTRAGEPLDTWPLNISRCCAWPIFALGPDELWVHIRQRIEDPNDPRDVRFGIQSLGPEGLQGAVTWIPDLELEQGRSPPLVQFEGRPYAPAVVWNAAPDGAVLYGVPDCVENPIEAGYRAALANRCWRSESIVDVFAADGRYLGEVEVPPGMTAAAGSATFVDAPMVVARFEDEAGTIMVKRYRLVLPGEE